MALPAIFLDRDGTLIEDAGFINTPEMIKIFPGVFASLRELQKKYLLFIVTNQSGIAKGILTAGQVAETNNILDNMFRKEGINISEWYVCPHDRSDDCGCIKPNPKFLVEAAEKYSLSLAESFVIGDHPHDPATADAVGACGLYLLTGHGTRHINELPPDRLVFHSFSEAAGWIANYPRHARDIIAAIQTGAETIRSGGLVAFPTETVYGLGADAFNPSAVAHIFDAKKRPLHDPLIVHISSPDDMAKLVESIPDNAWKLMEKFWPGPLTLVFPKSGHVPDIVTAGNSTVAVRMPSNSIALELIREAGTPVAAPSANMFGLASPTSAAHVKAQLDGAYDFLINGGACRVGVESTVLSLTGETPTVLRPGGVSREDIESVVGAVFQGGGQDGKMESPGMTEKHYAPTTPLLVSADIAAFKDRADVGKLFFKKHVDSFNGPCIILSEKGSPAEAAINLYYALRHLDMLGLEMIVAEPAPDYGLGVAVNDRLRKAGGRVVSRAVADQ